MSNSENADRRRSGRRRNRQSTATETPKRVVNYRQLKNPFPPMEVFPADQIADIHDSALRLLESAAARSTGHICQGRCQS